MLARDFSCAIGAMITMACSTCPDFKQRANNVSSRTSHSFNDSVRFRRAPARNSKLYCSNVPFSGMLLFPRSQFLANWKAEPTSQSWLRSIQVDLLEFVGSMTNVTR